MASVLDDARGGDAPSGTGKPNPEPKVNLSGSPALAKHLELFGNLRNKPHFSMTSGPPRFSDSTDVRSSNDAFGSPQSSGSNKHARRDTFNAQDASPTSGSEGFPLISSTETPAESTFATTDGSNSSAGPLTGGATNDNPKNPVRSASSSDSSIPSSSGSPTGSTNPAESALPHDEHNIRSYGEDWD
ncbi:hypothetical protein EV368DRAFT_79905 [Lentinula lateritia]|nr:hypothetical protein EV368DRAFT_79905 [Lentinula lateritia]